MKIAVIIPTLNEEQALPATLQRVAELGFDDLIVVDGGSTDRTAEIVTALLNPAPRQKPDLVGLKPFTIPIHPTLVTVEPGRARQMNAGALLSRAEVLLFLHADTQLPRSARHDIEQALNNAQYVGGRFDVQFERDTGLAWLIARLINLRSRWTGIATGDQAIFVKRDVFERLRITDIPLMEDVDFTSRLKQAGRVATLRALVVTSFRRWEQCGPVRTILLMWTLRFLYWLGVPPTRLQHFYSVIR